MPEAEYLPKFSCRHVNKLFIGIDVDNEESSQYCYFSCFDCGKQQNTKEKKVGIMTTLGF